MPSVCSYNKLLCCGCGSLPVVWRFSPTVKNFKIKFNFGFILFFFLRRRRMVFVTNFWIFRSVSYLLQPVTVNHFVFSSILLNFYEVYSFWEVYLFRKRILCSELFRNNYFVGVWIKWIEKEERIKVARKVLVTRKIWSYIEFVFRSCVLTSFW